MLSTKSENTQSSSSEYMTSIEASKIFGSEHNMLNNPVINEAAITGDNHIINNIEVSKVTGSYYNNNILL